MLDLVISSGDVAHCNFHLIAKISKNYDKLLVNVTCVFLLFWMHFLFLFLSFVCSFCGEYVDTNKRTKAKPKRIANFYPQI